MARSASFGFGGKLFFAIMGAVAGGFLWAMWETGTGPAALLKAFTSAVEEQPIAGTDPSKDPAKDPARDPVKVPPQPPPKDPVKEPPKDPPKEAPKAYLPAQINQLFTDVDAALRDGKIRAARDAVEKINKLLVPAESLSRFNDVELRVKRLWKLVLETTPGALIDPPEMAHLLFKGGGTGGIYVKNLVETGSEYRFETLDGIRSRKAKADVAELEKLDRLRGLAAVNFELERKAGYKGILLKTEAGKTTFEHKRGYTVAGMHYFELADFCARNGANRSLPALFDRAFELDRGIIDTVHENKAAALVNVLIYFISIRSKDDAKWTRDVLVGRYRETRAFQENVERDDELKKHYEDLFSEPLAVAKGPDKIPDKTPNKPVPDPTDPPPDPPRPPLVETAEPAPPDTGTTKLPDDAPAAAKQFCVEGDNAYAEAMTHLLNSDPNVNPEGWIKENKTALDCFTKAFEVYLKAQDLFGNNVPASLIKRFRETQMSRSLCRKRSVSSKK